MIWVQDKIIDYTSVTWTLVGKCCPSCCM